MGASFATFKDTPVDEVRIFRKSSESNVVIPELSENRHVTDPIWAFIFIICFLTSLALTGYVIHMADLDRLKLPSDECGNVCGKNNPKQSGLNCSGKNYVNKWYANMTRVEVRPGIGVWVAKNCIVYCPAIQRKGRACYPEMVAVGNKRTHTENFVKGILPFIFDQLWILVVTSLLQIVFATGIILLLLRYFPLGMTWFLLTTFIVFLVALIANGWIGLATIDAMFGSDHWMSIVSLVFYTAATIAIPFLVIFVAMNYKSVSKIALLLKEAICLMEKVPQCLVYVMLMYIFIVALVISILYLCFAFASAGHLYWDQSIIGYQRKFDVITWIASIWGGILVMWITIFAFNCFIMITSEALAFGYFRRVGEEERPPLNNIYNLIVYHFGSLAYGSLIMPLCFPFGILTSALIWSNECKIPCLRATKAFFKMFNISTIILIAFHGKSFNKCGVRSAHLSTANQLSEIATLLPFLVLGGLFILMGVLEGTIIVFTLRWGRITTDVTALTCGILVITVIVCAWPVCVALLLYIIIRALRISYWEDKKMPTDSSERLFNTSQNIKALFEESGIHD